jgi:glucosamine-6-phosphate deaminase
VIVKVFDNKTSVGVAAAEQACDILRRAIRDRTIDVAFVGIGENGRLAFNDPRADFQAEAPYLVVNLDEACRPRQVGEGWFVDIAEVPRQAMWFAAELSWRQAHH